MKQFITNLTVLVMSLASLTIVFAWMLGRPDIVILSSVVIIFGVFVSRRLIRL